MSNYITVLETERLILSQLNKHDAEFMYELVNSSSWIKYIGDRKIKNLRDAARYIKNNYAKDYPKGIGLFCVRQKRSEVPIGTCGLIDRDSLQHPDIGFALLDEYAGNGYVYEAARAVLDHAKKALMINKVCAITVAYNSRSINTLLSLGLKKKRKIRLSGDDEELLYFEN